VAKAKASSAKQINMPFRGGRPVHGPKIPITKTRPKFSRRTLEFKEREREKRRTIKARTTHKLAYVSDDPGRRETITHRETERRQTIGIGGETAQETIRARGETSQETIFARGEQQRQTASFRKSLQTGPKTEAPNLVSGVVRILIIVIVLSLLLLVLKNPGAGVASAGATGGFLNHFLTANPQPLFKAKA
jgi:small-conductance mechanosensitive channel